MKIRVLASYINRNAVFIGIVPTDDLSLVAKGRDADCPLADRNDIVDTRDGEKCLREGSRDY